MLYIDRCTALAGALLICFVCVGCDGSKGDRPKTSSENRVTAYIQKGIEKHIADKTRVDGGYYKTSFEGKELELKLVRVHTEYLANLGPGRHFACVDLATIDGDVYDVDFFLSGDPGAMIVTETTVHKTNGQPIYVWKQRLNKSWHRVPVKDAPPELLGVIKGSDEFEFIYRAKLPEIAGTAKMWIPMPTDDAFQKVELKSIDAPKESRVLEESEHGNKVLYFELGSEDSGETVELRYDVERFEKSVYKSQESSLEKYLAPARLVPASETFSEIAEKLVEGKEGNLVRGRTIYDYVIDQMRYMKYGSGWGKGDAVYACDAKTGNCTDFHSYFIALARSVGIPARFAIGAAIPSARNEGGIDGYHCWAEFYSDGRWWPVDISEGDKCSSLSGYYFGHHPANRIELSRGRDLVVEPGPASGPINFLAYPVLEIDGEPRKVKVEFSFNRKAGGRS